MPAVNGSAEQVSPEQGQDSDDRKDHRQESQLNKPLEQSLHTRGEESHTGAGHSIEMQPPHGFPRGGVASRLTILLRIFILGRKKTLAV